MSWDYNLPRDATIWGSLGQGLGGIAQAFAQVQQRKQQQDQDAFRNLQQQLQMFPNATPEQKQQWITAYEQQVGKNKFFDRSAFHFPTQQATPGTPGTPSAPQGPPQPGTSAIPRAPQMPGLSQIPGATGARPATPGQPGQPAGFMVPPTPYGSQTLRQMAAQSPNLQWTQGLPPAMLDAPIDQLPPLIQNRVAYSVAYGGGQQGTQAQTLGEAAKSLGFQLRPGVDPNTPVHSEEWIDPTTGQSDPQRFQQRYGHLLDQPPTSFQAEQRKTLAEQRAQGEQDRLRNQIKSLVDARISRAQSIAQGEGSQQQVHNLLQTARDALAAFKQANPTVNTDDIEASIPDSRDIYGAGQRARLGTDRQERMYQLALTRLGISEQQLAISMQRLGITEERWQKSLADNADKITPGDKSVLSVWNGPAMQGLKDGDPTKEAFRKRVTDIYQKLLPGVSDLQVPDKPPPGPRRLQGPERQAAYQAAHNQLTTAMTRAQQVGDKTAQAAAIKQFLDTVSGPRSQIGMSFADASKEVKAVFPDWGKLPQTPGTKQPAQSQSAPPGGAVGPAMGRKTVESPGTPPSTRASGLLTEYRKNPRPMKKTKFDTLKPEEQIWLQRNGVAVDNDQ